MFPIRNQIIISIYYYECRFPQYTIQIRFKLRSRSQLSTVFICTKHANSWGPPQNYYFKMLIIFQIQKHRCNNGSSVAAHLPALQRTIFHMQPKFILINMQTLTLPLLVCAVRIVSHCEQLLTLDMLTPLKIGQYTTEIFVIITSVLKQYDNCFHVFHIKY